jgi:peptidoglycan/LPS O-acetylase OafA/YrhL
MVDLFFILSGFIISYVNDADRQQPYSARQYRDFLVRRLIRLYPLLLFTLACFVLFRLAVAHLFHVAHVPGSEGWDRTSLEILAGQATLLSAWLPLPSAWNIPSWSISAEIFAYLLFPLMVGLHVKRPRSALVLLVAIPLAFYAWVAAGDGSLDIIRVQAPFRCLAGFSLGMLIFYFRDVVRRLVPAALSAIQIAAVAAALLCLATPVNDVAILPALFLIVAATWTDSGLFARLIGLRPFVYLGDISYSVYLNHVLSLQVVRFIWSYALARGMIGAGTASVILPIASLAVTLLASHLTFRLVEAPARHWLTQRILGRRDRPIELSPPAP